MNAKVKVQFARDLERAKVRGKSRCFYFTISILKNMGPIVDTLAVKSNQKCNCSDYSRDHNFTHLTTPYHSVAGKAPSSWSLYDIPYWNVLGQSLLSTHKACSHMAQLSRHSG